MLSLTERHRKTEGMTGFKTFECQNRFVIPNLQLRYGINSFFISVKHVLSPYAKNTDDGL